MTAPFELVAPTCQQKTHQMDHQQVIATFDIRNFLSRLEPTKQKNKYYCPVCGGHNLSINETGKYKCFNGCECRDIREAVSPWETVTSSTQAQTRCKVFPKSSQSRRDNPAFPIPEGEPVILRLAEIPQDIPQPLKPEYVPTSVKKALMAKDVSDEELKLISVIIYNYGEGKFAHRFECPCEANPKGRQKTFSVNRVHENGQTYWNKGQYAWSAYRLDEAIAAMKQIVDGIPVLLHQEGEKCVEAGRLERIISITTVGNTGFKDLVYAYNEIKFKMSDRPFIIAYCMDNDDTGLKKAQTTALAAAKSEVPFVVIDLKTIQPSLCVQGDVADILANGMTGDELEQALLKQISCIRDEAKDNDQDELDFIAELAKPNFEFTQQALNFLYGGKPWICADGKLYYWTGTNYKYSPDAIERPRIASFCNSFSKRDSKNRITFPYAKPTKVREVLQWVKYHFEVDSSLLDPPGINCTNGVLRIIWNGHHPNWKLIDHDPKLYYTYEPVVTYDPHADTTDCDRLLAVLDASQQEIFLRTIAASLDLATVRRYKGRLVRGLLLKGDGNNGKDTLREVVAAIYGYKGMTSCTLSDFKAYDTGRKFPLSRLFNSRVNWATENANTLSLDKLQSVKAFLTGDPLSAEGKGKDELDYTPMAVGLFNVNDTPNLQGTLEAIASRWGILNFTKTFKIGADQSKGELEADPRFKYDADFLRQKVLPAFLNRVLQALLDLMQSGIDYSCTKIALQEIQRENSHLFQFCQDIGLGDDPSSTLLATEMWDLLEQWYQDNGTLSYEESSNGKRKAIWNDQPRKLDSNVKAVNQVIARFSVLFPKAKVVPVPRVGGGKPRMGLQGIGLIQSLT